MTVDTERSFCRGCGEPIHRYGPVDRVTTGSNWVHDVDDRAGCKNDARTMAVPVEGSWEPCLWCGMPIRKWTDADSRIPFWVHLPIAGRAESAECAGGPDTAHPIEEHWPRRLWCSVPIWRPNAGADVWVHLPRANPPQVACADGAHEARPVPVMTPPGDPMGSFEEAAVMMHVMFEGYVAAGFSEVQACMILGTWLAAFTGGGTGKGGG